MSDVIAVMPATDFASKIAAQWGIAALSRTPHDLLPAPDGAAGVSGLDRGQIATAIKSAGPAVGLAVCYFGHGSETSWALYSDNHGQPPLTFERSIVELQDAPMFTGVIVASIACLSGKKLGREIAAKGGVFVGFEDLISWRPDIEQTEIALRQCLADVVRTVVRLGKAVTRADLEQVFAEHISYWHDQDRGGDGADNAGLASSYLSSVLNSMVVVKP